MYTVPPLSSNQYSLHHRWENIQNLFGVMESIRRNETENEYKILCNNSAMINYSSNPNIVHAIFVRRVKSFVFFFFGENFLDANWIWYRYEWQIRGNIHVHGLAKFKSDPGTNLILFDLFM